MFIFGNRRLQTRSLCQQHSVILTEWKSSLAVRSPLSPVVAEQTVGLFPRSQWRCAFSAPSGESLHWRAQTRRDSPLYLNIRDSPLYLNIRDSPLYLNIRDSLSTWTYVTALSTWTYRGPALLPEHPALSTWTYVSLRLYLFRRRYSKLEARKGKICAFWERLNEPSLNRVKLDNLKVLFTIKCSKLVWLSFFVEHKKKSHFEKGSVFS